MANSPLLYGPNSKAINLQNGEIISSGAYIRDNGDKNYIGYSNFENGLTTGWSLGTVGTLTNNLPTGSPTFGSGASGNLSIAAATSNPLSGTYSLSLVSSAATTSGNMLASAALPIDIADQAKVLSFKFNYQATSNPGNGNFSGTSSNSFAVAVYDVTNSSWLTSAGNFNLVQSTGVGICTGTCQTNATTASVRFVIYNANATTGAITMYFDTFFLGPQIAQGGAAMNDWTSYTPTGTWLLNSPVYAGRYRRVGDSAEIQAQVTLGGAPTATGLIFNLPTGLTIDTTKLVGSGADTINISATGNGLHASGSIQLFAVYHSTTSVAVGYLSSVSTAAFTAVNATAPVTWASTDIINITYTVPIVGWSSNSVMSNDTDTRVVSWNGTQTTQAATANVTDIAFTTTKDRTGSWNGTQYVVPVAGDYLASCCWNNNNASTTVVYLNGSSYATGANTGANTFQSTTILVTNCKPGDLISYRTNITGTITSGNASVFRLSGPAVIAATESVNARYFATSTAPGTSASPLAITYTTKDYDSHNSYASGTYTIPVTGKYQISAAMLQTAGTTAANQAVIIQLLKNGTQTSGSEIWFTSTTSKPITSTVTDQISCNAGDTITVKAGNDGTTPAASASNFMNFFTIARIGN